MEKQLRTARPQRIPYAGPVPGVSIDNLHRRVGESAERVDADNASIEKQPRHAREKKRAGGRSNLNAARHLEMTLVTHALDLENLAEQITKYARSLDQLANLVHKLGRRIGVR
jgi:hypothetical protein